MLCTEVRPEEAPSETGILNPAKVKTFHAEDVPDKRDNPNKNARLSHSDIARALALINAGRLQCDVAAEIGCSEAAITKLLQRFGDTRGLARKRLRGGALQASERLLRKGKPKELLRVLEDLRVLVPPQQGPQNVQQNVIVLGARTAPGDILASLSPGLPVIESESLKK